MAPRNQTETDSTWVQDLARADASLPTALPALPSRSTHPSTGPGPSVPARGRSVVRPELRGQRLLSCPFQCAGAEEGQSPGVQELLFLWGAVARTLVTAWGQGPPADSLQPPLPSFGTAAELPDQSRGTARRRLLGQRQLRSLSNQRERPSVRTGRVPSGRSHGSLRQAGAGVTASAAPRSPACAPTTEPPSPGCETTRPGSTGVGGPVSKNPRIASAWHRPQLQPLTAE